MPKVPDEATIWPAGANMTEDVEMEARKNPIKGKDWNELLQRLDDLTEKVNEIVLAEGRRATYGAPPSADETA